uniref:hypothetical protein n=1 Tax=Candidatus Protochlamydia sp. W-9 TaxID=1785087 RepID=UPI001D042978
MSSPVAPTPNLHWENIFQGSPILGRQEAQSRLRNLIPNTEEHSKLQAALIKTAGIVEISLSNMNYKVDTCPKNHLVVGGFGSAEHVAIGEAVQLKGLPKDVPLLTKGVTPIRFQHIVALAGDFYGVAGQAISLPGGTDEEKTERFIKAFDTLAQASNDEIRKILLEIDQECTAVTHSSLPHHCYSNQMIEKNNAIKKIKNDIDELLIDNSDHFSSNAQDAYRIGHALALIEARDAGERQDIEGLKRAYALDAFACHFLTDLFASGHIRNQRGELEVFLISQLKFPKDMAKKLAGILTGAQHEKDGHEGLNVANQRGDRWRAYGDGNFFSPKNVENKEKVITATQQSVDEIYAAYLHPDSSLTSRVDELIPYVTPFNPPPLYSVEETHEGTQLFLHKGSDKIEIKTRKDYLYKCLCGAALGYLPENYINGFIKGFITSHIALFGIKTPPVFNKVIIPQIQRLTGSAWSMVGIATYHQIQQQSEQLNAKVDELADTAKAMYDNSVKIMEQLHKFNAQLSQLSWTSLFQEIKGSIASIQDIRHQHKLYKATLTEGQLDEAERKLWEVHIRMSRVFSESNADGMKLLSAYETMLQEISPMGPFEIKIAVTLWFRQMLDYQVQAFCMYGILQARKNGDMENQSLLQSQVLAFETSLFRQIEASKDHIDEELIYEHPSYITLQLEKSKTKR